MAVDETIQRAPLARTEGLSIRELGDELLIYDRKTDEAHCLSPVAARVWRSCDGQRPLAELGENDEVAAALVELADKDLLLQPVPAHGSGMSRRHFVGRMAVVAAATPLIVSATAADAAQIASCVAQNAPCTPGGTGVNACCAGLTCTDVNNDPRQPKYRCT